MVLLSISLSLKCNNEKKSYCKNETQQKLDRKLRKYNIKLNNKLRKNKILQEKINYTFFNLFENFTNTYVLQKPTKCHNL